jgi:hypothetical protein
LRWFAVIFFSPAICFAAYFVLQLSCGFLPLCHAQLREFSDSVIGSLSIEEEDPLFSLPLLLESELPIHLRLSVFNSESTDKEVEERPRRVNPYPIPKRIDISHIEGKGIGYETGYTKLEVIFGPEYRLGHFLPLVDIEASVLDDGKIDAGIGFIGRYIPKTLCEIFGFNIFYGFRQGKLGNYQQLNGGFEILNKRWELHTNAYVPVGVKTHQRTYPFDDFIGDFHAVKRRYEFAGYAFDVNAGYYFVNGKHFQLYASVGPYYISGKFHDSAWGGKFMFRPQYRDYLAIEFSASHDRIFETIYQVNVVFTIPLYHYSSAIKSKKGPCGIPNRQIYQPVDPNVILQEKCCWRFNW